MYRVRRTLPAILLFSAISACADRELPPIPPGAPQQGEVTISGEDDPVAEACSSEGVVHNPQRVLITHSREWGTIWRGDFVASTEGQPLWWRFVCWSNGRLLRPLEMFDPSQSIPPLP
jgi:hypothetical protein